MWNSWLCPCNTLLNLQFPVMPHVLRYVSGIHKGFSAWGEFISLVWSRWCFSTHPTRRSAGLWTLWGSWYSRTENMHRNITMGLPVGTPFVEWSYSQMKLIKAHLSSCLSDSNLEHFMKITIEGPPLTDIDFDQTLDFPSPLAWSSLLYSTSSFTYRC